MNKELYTIGHSNYQIERFIDLLKMHSINAICDVRSQPYSRHNPQFNREVLQPRLKENHITYVFLGSELGARSNDTSCYLNGKVQFNCLSQTSDFRKEKMNYSSVWILIVLRLCVQKKIPSCVIERY